MQITAIRHLKTTAKEGVCYGKSNVSSNFNNLKLLDSIKTNLSSFYTENTYIYSSDLKRCHELSLLISPQIICLDSRLQELNFGEWEMKEWKEIHLDPRSKSWFDDYTNTSTPNGESYNDLIHRIQCFLKDLKQEHNNKRDTNIIVFTHAGVIRALSYLLSPTPISKKNSLALKCDYGTLHKFYL